MFPLLTILSVTTEQVDGLLAYAGGLFTDLSPVVMLAIGLPVGFWIISKAISLVRGRV